MTTLEQMGVQRWRRRELGRIDDQSLKLEEQRAEAVPSTTVVSGESSSLVDVDAYVSKSHPSEEQNDTTIAEAPQNALLDSSQQASSSDVKPATSANVGWTELADLVAGGDYCQSCAKTNPVLGDGNMQASWVFVFDAPSHNDVRHQQLLSGRDGHLFDAILDALDLTREKVYLTSVFKCPPAQGNDLAAQCGDLVHRQIELINPKSVIAFGEFASQTVLRANESLEQLRVISLPTINNSTKVAATYGLAQMLQSPELKASVWQDLKKCLASS